MGSEYESEDAQSADVLTAPSGHHNRGKRVHKVYIVGGFAFVPHPLARGLWLRTDLSVAKVACSFDGCNAEIGVPCRRMRYRGNPAAMEPQGYVSSTHWVRRRDARNLALPDNADEIQFTVRRSPP